MILFSAGCAMVAAVYLTSSGPPSGSVTFKGDKLNKTGSLCLRILCLIKGNKTDTDNHHRYHMVSFICGLKKKDINDL